MSNVAKRINIISIKTVKESSFLYQKRQILSPNDDYEMIKEQLEGVELINSSKSLHTLSYSLDLISKITFFSLKDTESIFIITHFYCTVLID